MNSIGCNHFSTGGYGQGSSDSAHWSGSFGQGHVGRGGREPTQDEKDFLNELRQKFAQNDQTGDSGHGGSCHGSQDSASPAGSDRMAGDWGGNSEGHRPHHGHHAHHRSHDHANTNQGGGSQSGGSSGGGLSGSGGSSGNTVSGNTVSGNTGSGAGVAGKVASGGAASQTTAAGNGGETFVTSGGQAGEGDCDAISPLRAIESTPQGLKELRNCITEDGSNYKVTFPTRPGQTFTIPKSEVNNPSSWGTTAYRGNPKTAAIIDAAYKALGVPQGAGLGTGAVQKLFTNNTNTTDLKGQSSAQVEQMLKSLAPKLGNSTGVSFSGVAGNGGDLASAGQASHEFALTGINLKTGTVTYTNPWDESVNHKMSLSQFSNILAQGSWFTTSNFGNQTAAVA